MNVLAPLWIRIVAFVVWPVVTPLLLLALLLVCIILWPLILFRLTRNYRRHSIF